MSGEQLLVEMQAAGVRVGCADGELYADVLPGSDVAPYAERIKATKPQLLRALDLRERIIAAVTVDPARFDRPASTALWQQWHQENPT